MPVDQTSPDAVLAYSQDFPVLLPPGLARWKWDPVLDGISFAPPHPPFRQPLKVTAALESAPWWERLLDEDGALLRKYCLECLAGRGDSLDLAARARRLDCGWGWLLVRGNVLALDGRRELAGYVVDVSRLSGDVRFFPRFNENDFERGAADTYRAMLENSPDPIFRWDRTLYPLYANPAVSEHLRGAPEGPGNTTIWNLGISDELAAFHRRNVEKVFETGGSLRRIGCFSTSLKSEVVCEYSYWPEFGPDGAVGSVICHVRDITVHARAEEERRLNEERLIALNRLTQMQEATEEDILNFALEQIALLTKSRHSYICFPDESGRRRMYWSKSMHDLAGTENLPADKMPHEVCGNAHEFDGEEIRRPYIANIRNKADCHLVFGTLQVRRYAIYPALEDGRVVCIASVCNKDRDYDEADLRQLELFINGAWLVLRRSRHMHMQEKARKSAESANRAKDDFLATVSHELRTPLNGMLSMLELLQLSPLSEDQSSYVRVANSSGKALLRIISDILDFSRMESGRIELRNGVFDVRETFYSAMSPFRSQARRKGLEASVILDPRLPAQLVGDDARLRQIIFNLAGNALKFTSAGSIRLECALLPYPAPRALFQALPPPAPAFAGSFSTGQAPPSPTPPEAPQAGVWLYLAVSDTGTGIPEQAHGTIFDAFTQLDSSSTRRFSGTGLGLGIVKRLLRAMGGSLTVESGPGEGTAMHCSLPFALPSAQEESAADRRAGRDRRSGGDRRPESERRVVGERRKRADRRFGDAPEDGEDPDARCIGPERLEILVAEDDPVGRFALRAFLLRTGHRPTCVSTGLQALEALRLHAFDCLITDIQMPIMDGLESTRRIREGDFAGIFPSDEVVGLVHTVIPESETRPYPDAVPRDLPIVAVTARAMSGDREDFLRAGIDMYLAKPIILNELREVLETLVQNKLAGLGKG